MRIAIPTDNPGGLNAPRSEHFGHCDVFTIIELANGQEAKVDVVQNVPHGAGGCIEPVNVLKEAGVDAIVVAGMGARPMQGFSEAGITVYYADNRMVPDARTAMEKLSGTGLPVMQPTQVCKGGGDCHH